MHPWTIPEARLLILITHHEGHEEHEVLFFLLVLCGQSKQIGLPYLLIIFDYPLTHNLQITTSRLEP
jgi:hypothetical protein